MSGLSVGLLGAEGSNCGRNRHKGAVDNLVSVFGVVLGAHKQSSRG
jgi:hypothetical protein